MNIRTHFRNVPVTVDLEEYVQKKIGAVEKRYAREPLVVDLDVIRVGKEYESRCRLNGSDSLVMTASDFNVFVCVNSITSKMNSVLRREKEKRIKTAKKQCLNRGKFFGYADYDEQEEWQINSISMDDLVY